MAEAKPKIKRIKNFQDSWLVEYKWLQYDEDAKAMCCTVCKKAKKLNTFTAGCTDFQKSSLTRHLATQSHQAAQTALKSASVFKTFVKNAETKSHDGIVPQLKTVHWMVSENIALSKYNNLVDLQVSNGASITGIYRHHSAVEDMLQSLSESAEKQVAAKIDAAKFIGVLTDESCDIAILKKLIIYLQVLSAGRVELLFGANVDVPDGKAHTIVNALKECFASRGIPLNKVTGLGSDGAAVMTGRKAGVGVLLKADSLLLIHVHCVAHRLALTVSQSAREIKQLKQFEETVHHVFNYYNNSAVRYNRLRELQEAINSATVALKEPNSVRWLSLHEAVTAINKCWSALVAALGEDAANGNAVAIGLSKKVETYAFVAHSCIMFDILPLFTKLSKTFQAENLDYDKVETMLEVTREGLSLKLDNNDAMAKYKELKNCPIIDGKIEWQGIMIKKSDGDDTTYDHQKVLFINELLANLERRFPQECMSFISKLNKVLNVRKLKSVPALELVQYAEIELNELCDHMTQPNAPDVGFNAERAKQDFQMFKLYARASLHTTLAEFGHELISAYADDYPDFAILMEYFLVVPMNSATCERGFSAQNLIKTKSRNRLGEERLNQLLRVSINGPTFGTFDYYQNAAENFRAICERRK